MNAHNNSIVVLKDCLLHGPEIFDGHQAMPSPAMAAGDATFGGTFTVDNCVIRTNGGASSALSTDFGGGFFKVTNTYAESNTTGSGGIYAALAGKQTDLTHVPTVSSLRETDFLFLERDGAIYKIRASAVIIPSGGGDGIETESGDALLTEDGQELLLDTGDDEQGAVTTESGARLLTENNEPITIDQ